MIEANREIEFTYKRNYAGVPGSRMDQLLQEFDGSGKVEVTDAVRERVLMSFYADVQVSRLRIGYALLHAQKSPKRAHVSPDRIINDALLPLFRDARAEMNFEEVNQRGLTDLEALKSQIDPKAGSRKYRDILRGREIDQVVFEFMNDPRFDEDVKRRLLVRYAATLSKTRSNVAKRVLLEIDPKTDEDHKIAILREKVADLMREIEREIDFKSSDAVQRQQKDASVGDTCYPLPVYADIFDQKIYTDLPGGDYEKLYEDGEVEEAVAKVCASREQGGSFYPESLKEGFLRYFRRNRRRAVDAIQRIAAKNKAQGIKQDLDFAVGRLIDAKRTDIEIGMDVRGYKRLMEELGNEPVSAKDFKFRKKESDLPAFGGAYGRAYSRHRPRHLQGVDLSFSERPCIRHNYRYLSLHHTHLDLSGESEVMGYVSSRTSPERLVRKVVGINEKCELVFEDGYTGYPQEYMRSSEETYEDYCWAQQEKKRRSSRSRGGHRSSRQRRRY